MTNTNTISKSDQLLARIAESIITSIETGQVTGEWRKPWKSMSVPINASTRKAYKGINLLWFWSVADDLGYRTNHWATYKQWQSMGAQVRKGETGTQGIKWVAKICKDHGDDEQCSKCGKMFPTVFTVFNADQVDGYDPVVDAELPESERLERADQFFAAIGGDVRYGGDTACYVPALDQIRLPMFEDFRSGDAFYSTLGHEYVHWSGAKNRTDRDLTGRFGDESYAMEELIAELGAAMLCGHLQITDTPRPDHAQYLSTWLKVLKNDSKALYTAASKASAAVEYLVTQAESRAEVAA